MVVPDRRGVKRAAWPRGPSGNGCERPRPGWPASRRPRTDTPNHCRPGETSTQRKTGTSEDPGVDRAHRRVPTRTESWRTGTSRLSDDRSLSSREPGGTSDSTHGLPPSHSSITGGDIQRLPPLSLEIVTVRPSKEIAKPGGGSDATGNGGHCDNAGVGRGVFRGVGVALTTQPERDPRTTTESSANTTSGPRVPPTMASLALRSLSTTVQHQDHLAGLVIDRGTGEVRRLLGLAPVRAQRQIRVATGRQAAARRFGRLRA